MWVTQWNLSQEMCLFYILSMNVFSDTIKECMEAKNLKTVFILQSVSRVLFILFLGFYVCLSWDRVSLGGPHWPRTPHVAQAGHELTILLSPKCWDCRLVLLCLMVSGIYESQQTGTRFAFRKLNQADDRNQKRCRLFICWNSLH